MVVDVLVREGEQEESIEDRKKAIIDALRNVRDIDLEDKEIIPPSEEMHSFPLTEVMIANRLIDNIKDQNILNAIGALSTYIPEERMAALKDFIAIDAFIGRVDNLGVSSKRKGEIKKTMQGIILSPEFEPAEKLMYVSEVFHAKSSDKASKKLKKKLQKVDQGTIEQQFTLENVIENLVPILEFSRSREIGEKVTYYFNTLERNFKRSSIRDPEYMTKLKEIIDYEFVPLYTKYKEKEEERQKKIETSYFHRLINNEKFMAVACMIPGILSLRMPISTPFVMGALAAIGYFGTKFRKQFRKDRAIFKIIDKLSKQQRRLDALYGSFKGDKEKYFTLPVLADYYANKIEAMDEDPGLIMSRFYLELNETYRNHSERGPHYLKDMEDFFQARGNLIREYHKNVQENKHPFLREHPILASLYHGAAGLVTAPIANIFTPGVCLFLTLVGAGRVWFARNEYNKPIDDLYNQALKVQEQLDAKYPLE